MIILTLWFCKVIDASRDYTTYKYNRKINNKIRLHILRAWQNVDEYIR